MGRMCHKKGCCMDRDLTNVQWPLWLSVTGKARWNLTMKMHEARRVIRELRARASVSSTCLQSGLDFDCPILCLRRNRRDLGKKTKTNGRVRCRVWGMWERAPMAYVTTLVRTRNIFANKRMRRVCKEKIAREIDLSRNWYWYNGVCFDEISD